MFHRVTLPSSVAQAPSGPVEFGGDFQSGGLAGSSDTPKPRDVHHNVDGCFLERFLWGLLFRCPARSALDACPENISPGVQISLANLSLALMPLG